ncbi:hypothetical protein SAMN05421839_12534 [Halolactibacillus halophilus]|uniref:Uncharacterized protein n=1 Tax=Halolactibacillus halophilus TaxID=306540 RepID=A0A1I5QXK1_9BACI|nr:hypothetical protein [Halolactibacillus halophilus]GEM02003.1 hypothetical protein HHA03_15350 [Halolactibacillus halophilus]SFP50982.1 hypothetical protein SAMN05421839_12534 [Halolactibacillus halophilus]
MKIEFFTDARLSEMWGYIKMLLEMVAPGVMIFFAIATAGLLISIIAKSFRQASKEKDGHDYDYQEY